LSVQFFGDVTVGTEGEAKAHQWAQIGVRFEKANSDLSISRRESDRRNLDDPAASSNTCVLTEWKVLATLLKPWALQTTSRLAQTVSLII